MGKIDIENDFTGKCILRWEDHHQNAYVITGPQMSSKGSDFRVGRLAQVRISAGEFGSDEVILRHVDDSLVRHSNQIFFLIPLKYKDYLDGLFEGTFMDNPEEQDYTINNGENPEKGFIVPSKRFNYFLDNGGHGADIKTDDD